LSRLTNSDTIAKVDLLNAEAASGPSIINVQKAINNKTYKTYVVQQVSAGGTISSDITIGLQYRRIEGLTGAVTLSGTPFGAVGGWVDGMVIKLVGTSDANKVTLVNSDSANGAILNGTMELGKYSIIELIWDAVLVRWIETGRNS